MRLLLIAVTALALGACSSKVENKAEPAAAAANASNAATDVAAQVAALPENQRNGVFLRAIRDSDISCQDVNKAEQIEPTQGAPTWRAYCDDGDAHLIVIKPDGSAQVISRTTR